LFEFNSKNGDIGNVDGNLICLPALPLTSSLLHFPVSETEINQWVYSDNQAKIIAHGWGIWAGLTSFFGSVDGTPTRAFETWNTTNNMLYQIKASSGVQSQLLKNKATVGVLEDEGLKLSLPNQFKNSAHAQKSTKEVKVVGGADTNIFVSVAYNPPAAKHTIDNRLLLQSTLKQYLAQGYTDIPNFPSNAITVKPVYKLITQDKLTNGIYIFPGWPGTPSPAKAFPESDWNQCVYVDINATQSSANSNDPNCNNRTDENTFALNDFIYEKIDQDNAEYLTKQLSLGDKNVKAGDYAILIGMHVTSREVTRWTWQTFWWSANVDTPYLPSSEAIAAARPDILDSAAKHYAMALTYSMVAPAQPITGGSSIGTSVIGYNPHLEAGFDPDTFQIVRSINNMVNGKSTNTVNAYGVQTNCMTCHNLAQFDPNKTYNSDNRETPYGTDYYMATDDDEFSGKLRLDFAWSLLASMETDDQPAK
jgi:hypothetical protein